MSPDQKEHEMLKRKIWIDTFVAAIGRGHQVSGATSMADDAKTQFSIAFDALDRKSVV